MEIREVEFVWCVLVVRMWGLFIFALLLLFESVTEVWWWLRIALGSAERSEMPMTMFMTSR